MWNIDALHRVFMQASPVTVLGPLAILVLLMTMIWLTIIKVCCMQVSVQSKNIGNMNNFSLHLQDRESLVYGCCILLFLHQLLIESQAPLTAGAQQTYICGPSLGTGPQQPKLTDRNHRLLHSVQHNLFRSTNTTVREYKIHLRLDLFTVPSFLVKSSNHIITLDLLPI